MCCRPLSSVEDGERFPDRRPQNLRKSRKSGHSEETDEGLLTTLRARQGLKIRMDWGWFAVFGAALDDRRNIEKRAAGRQQPPFGGTMARLSAMARCLRGARIRQPMRAAFRDGFGENMRLSRSPGSAGRLPDQPGYR